MAQAAKALSVARFFTEEGTHPYDMFDWVKLESKIVNPGTGKVVFEQQDAEFPDFWSQNAINIVAQKYFYGTPGTDGREKSREPALVLCLRPLPEGTYSHFPQSNC